MSKVFFLCFTAVLFNVGIVKGQGLPANPWGNRQIDEQQSMQISVQNHTNNLNKGLPANPWSEDEAVIIKNNTDTSLQSQNNDPWANVRTSERKVLWSPRIHNVKTSAGKTDTTLTSLRFRSDKQTKNSIGSNSSTSSSDFDSFLYNLKNVGYNIPDSSASSSSSGGLSVYKNIGNKGLNTVKNTTSPITGTVNNMIREIERKSGFNLHNIFN